MSWLSEFYTSPHLIDPQTIFMTPYMMTGRSTFPVSFGPSRMERKKPFGVERFLQNGSFNPTITLFSLRFCKDQGQSPCQFTPISQHLSTRVTTYQKSIDMSTFKRASELSASAQCQGSRGNLNYLRWAVVTLLSLSLRYIYCSLNSTHPSLSKVASMRIPSNAATAFILLLQLYESLTLISAQDTPLLPAVKFKAEPREDRPAVIRGLIDPDLSKRQTYYYCPAPSYGCESYYCCPNVNYRCCRGESPIVLDRQVR